MLTGYASPGEEIVHNLTYFAFVLVPAGSFALEYAVCNLKFKVFSPLVARK